MRHDAQEVAPFVALVHETDGVPVLKASGELDLLASYRFREALQEALTGLLEYALSTAESPVLIVDLSAVEFMDSAGVNALVGETRNFLAEGGLVRVVTKDSPAQRTLSVTGLDRIFAVYPDVGSAAGRGVA